MKKQFPIKDLKKIMLRLMKFTVLKVGENSKEICLLRNDLDRNTEALKKLRKDIRTGFGCDNDLHFKILEMHNRLWEIEKQIEMTAIHFPYLKEEYNRIYSETLKLFPDIDDNPNAKVQIDELNVWVKNLEEKILV